MHYYRLHLAFCGKNAFETRRHLFFYYGRDILSVQTAVYRAARFLTSGGRMPQALGIFSIIDFSNCFGKAAYIRMKEIFALDGYRNIYFVGIGGSSMSSLAMIMKNRGVQVKGYDRAVSAETEMLEKSGITVYHDTQRSHFDGADLVVYTVAFSAEHPEMKIAYSLGVPVITRAKLLEAIAAGYKKSIGVAGTHGKSTTSGMLSQIFLSEHGCSPTILIGAPLPAVGAAYKIGSDDNFIFEACEYKDSFLNFYPKIAVILNVRLDHTDYFPSMERLAASFRQYMNNAGADGTAIVNADSPDAVRASEGVLPKVLFYSTIKADADFYAGNIAFEHGCGSFDFYKNGARVCRINLSVPGEFNVSNALAAAAAASISGISKDAITRALADFRGVSRRFEYLGNINGARFYTDYAHHPDELGATLKAARSVATGRLVTLFQPHTFTRLHDFFDEFASSFSCSDLALFTDVFSARETNRFGIGSRDLASAAGGIYLPSLEDSADYLLENTHEGDTVMLMGAGDVNLVWDIMIKKGKK